MKRTILFLAALFALPAIAADYGFQKSTTGQRYVCIDTAGKLVSSSAACSGT